MGLPPRCRGGNAYENPDLEGVNALEELPRGGIEAGENRHLGASQGRAHKDDP
jgi:hypothetical protein